MTVSDLTGLRSTARYFVGHPSAGICLMFFSRWDRVMGLGQEDIRGKVFLFTASYQRRILSTWRCWPRPGWGRVPQVFSSVNVVFFPLSLLHSLEGHCLAHIQGWGTMLPLLEGIVPITNYLEFFCTGDLSLPHLLMYSIMYLHKCRVYLYICVAWWD